MRRVGLFLDNHPRGGGAFQYSLSMLEAVSMLPRNSYHPIVAYTRPTWSERLKEIDVNSVYVPMSFVSRTAEHIWRKAGLSINGWRKMISRFDPPSRHLLTLGCDLWIYPAQDSMAYMLPVPALTTVHDLMHRYEPNFPEVSGFRMREIHYRATCRWAKGVLVDSEIGKKQLVESYGIDPIQVHPLPFVAPAYMMNNKVDPQRFNEHYRLPSRFFFYPAQLWKHKNHCALLRAAHLLSKTHPDIEFVFSGVQKNASNSISELAYALGISDRVHNIGYIPDGDMAVMYSRARALVMPTFFGPTNIPPLEAMVTGCPMAVSRIYGMPEQCGDAALYFDPNSDKEIADVLALLWSDDTLCTDLAARGRARASRYKQTVFNERVAAIVDQVIASIQGQGV